MAYSDQDLYHEIGALDDCMAVRKGQKWPYVFLENRIQKINLILNILLIEVKTSEVTKQLNISYGYKIASKRQRNLSREQSILSKVPEYATLCIWRLSEEERRADALALRADERRDKLRKAMGRCKWPLIHGYLNGETCMSIPHATCTESIGAGREPGELKHLSSRRKRKKIFDFQSSGERNGKSPNRCACMSGFGLHKWSKILAERYWKDRQ